MKPSPTESNGRDSSGKFTAGNSAGKGNPYAKRVGQLRTALLDAITEDDMRDVISAMVKKAKGGDVAAARILFDRCLGPSEASDVLARLEDLEAQLKGVGE